MSLDTIQLETSGKGEKIEKTDAVKRLKDIEDVKTYLAKLVQTAPGKTRNPLLQEQVTTFLEKAANNGLGKNMEKFNAKKFDTDGEVGLDNFEFEKFSDAIKGAIGQIVALDGVNAFDRVHSESQETAGWSNPDKWIAGKADVGKYVLGEKGSSSFAEEALKKVGSISPEEFHKIQEKPFSLSVESGKDLAILLAKEVGSGVEDLLRFLTNIPSGIILLPRYLSYRMDSNSSDVQKKTEGEIKLGELVESNSSLAIIELLGEKGIDMIKQLANMMKSGKQGDIATILVTIAGLIAGGAGAVKFASSMARKSAVRAAREAGSAGRKAGEVMARESRNTLRNVSNTAGKVAEVANKVDNIVSGNAALGKVASVAGNGVRKVAPAFGVAANDASNVSEIERARSKKQKTETVDAVGQVEVKATGTDGPTRGPRMSADSPFDGVSTDALQNQYELSRIITGQDARLTQREGDLMREIQKRTNPNTPEVVKIPNKKLTPTPIEGAPSNIVDFAEKQARELGRFRDEVLMSGSKPPLLYIERGGTIEIGRMVRMVDGKAIVEFMKDGKISQKPYSLEDLARLNDPEKRIHPSITREIQEKRGKMQQAYEKSGISPLEIQKNSGLSSEDRIKKAEAIMGRVPDQWEALAIDHIHENISKGIYKNGIGDLRKMAQAWEQMTGNSMKDKAKFAEFRKLVEHGILGQDIELVVLKEASKKITHDIDVYGVDHILDKIKDRKLNQSQLNAVVFEYFEAHGSSIESLDKFLKNSLDVNGYTGDTVTMFSEAMRYAKEMKFEEFIIKIDEKSVQDIMKHMMTDTENSSKILKSFLENGKSTTKLEFFKSLEYNDTLLSSIVTGEHADIFINAISKHTKDLAKVISSIINNESTLRKMAPENLKTLEVLLEQMIKEENYNGSIIGTLRSKLALARDAKSPKNRIKYFLENRDEEILAKLRETFSSEKATWNIMFDDYRVQDGGVKERMNMIERGERSFFTQHSLEIFIHLTFPELPLAAQKEFVKKFVAATDAKYHCLLDEFPGFKKEIAEHGWI